MARGRRGCAKREPRQLCVTRSRCPPPLAGPRSALQVALVHDLAEAVVGDITPDQGVSEDDKHARERVRCAGA